MSNKLPGIPRKNGKSRIMGEIVFGTEAAAPEDAPPDPPAQAALPPVFQKWQMDVLESRAERDNL